jgi:hypothetical protein
MYKLHTKICVKKIHKKEMYKMNLVKFEPCQLISRIENENLINRYLFIGSYYLNSLRSPQVTNKLISA